MVNHELNKKNKTTLELFHASLSDSELYHHGILGMKWGVRRYQNADGSLTAAGKQRYLKNPKADSYSSEKEFTDNLTKKGRRRLVDKRSGELIQKGKDAMRRINIDHDYRVESERAEKQFESRSEAIEKSKLGFKKNGSTTYSDYDGHEAIIDGEKLGNKGRNRKDVPVSIDVSNAKSVDDVKSIVTFLDGLNRTTAERFRKEAAKELHSILQDTMNDSGNKVVSVSDLSKQLNLEHITNTYPWPSSKINFVYTIPYNSEHYIDYDLNVAVDPKSGKVETVFIN